MPVDSYGPVLTISRYLWGNQMLIFRQPFHSYIVAQKIGELSESLHRTFAVNRWQLRRSASAKLTKRHGAPR